MTREQGWAVIALLAVILFFVATGEVINISD